MLGPVPISIDRYTTSLDSGDPPKLKRTQAPEQRPVAFDYSLPIANGTVDITFYTDGICHQTDREVSYMDKPTYLMGFASRTALVGLLLCAGANAEAPKHPFSGRWRMDTSSLRGSIKPTIIHLADGSFKRDDYDIVRTDGLFHQVAGGGYVDEQSISVENDRVVREVDRVRGKLAYTVEYVVSPDGGTLTWHVASYTSPNGQAVTSETVQRRVGAPTNGAHLISGTWKRVSVTVDSKSDWIMRLDGDRFSWRTEGGTGYDAVIGGRPVKIDGDNSGSRAKITRPRPDTIIETDLSSRGKREAVLSMRLMPDGKTIRGTAQSPQKKRSTTFYLHKIAE